MAFHGKPRYTGDLDVFIQPSDDNAARFLAAMKVFGAPTASFTPEELATPGVTVTFGAPPRRIDILNWLSGVSWDEASRNAVPGDLGGIAVRFLGLETWHANKKAANRERDQEDLKKL
jgi:hypothetical protein